MSNLFWFQILTLAMVFGTLSSCAPSRYTQDSGLHNSLNISLDDPNVSFEQVTTPIEGKSVAGVLINSNPAFAIDANVIQNNNGIRTGYLRVAGGNLLAVFSGMTSMVTIGTTLGLLFPADETSIEPLRIIGIGISAVLGGAAFNDFLCRRANYNRTQAAAKSRIMDNAKNAHFFCLQQSQTHVRPRLFSTEWSGEVSLLSGTIKGVSEVNIEPHSDDFTDNNVSPTGVWWPEYIDIQPSELLGSTGMYEYEIRQLTPFVVIDVLEKSQKLKRCVVEIQFEVNGQNETRRLSAADETLYFQEPGPRK